MRSSTGSPLFRGRSSRRGFILLSVLMVSMFLMSAAVGYGWCVRDQVRRVDRRRFELECRNIVLLAVKNVIRGLASDKNGYDSVHERWFGEHIIPIGDSYLVSVTILPLDDKLPLGNIFLPDGTTLRGEMEIPWNQVWEEVELPGLAAPTLDFMDSDRTPRVGGYERPFFPNRMPGDPGAFTLFPEIKLDRLVGNDERPGLKDLLTPWCGSKINVNTASEKVLALLEGIDEVTAREIVARRDKTPFKKLSELAEMPAFSNSLGPKLSNALGTTSDYFSVSVYVSSLEADRERSYNIVVTKKSVLYWEEL